MHDEEVNFEEAVFRIGTDNRTNYEGTKKWNYQVLWQEAVLARVKANVNFATDVFGRDSYSEQANQTLQRIFPELVTKEPQSRDRNKLQQLYSKEIGTLMTQESNTLFGDPHQRREQAALVSTIEEEIASLVANSDPHGQSARRGAVRYALLAGDADRAKELVEKYACEQDTGLDFVSELRNLLPDNF